jgi:hypothetical protein
MGEVAQIPFEVAMRRTGRLRSVQEKSGRGGWRNLSLKCEGALFLLRPRTAFCAPKAITGKDWTCNMRPIVLPGVRRRFPRIRRSVRRCRRVTGGDLRVPAFFNNLDLSLTIGRSSLKV